MAISISIESSIPDVFQQLARLPTEVGAKAMRRALDRTMVTARKEMGDAIYGEFALRKSDINQKLFVTKPRVRSGGFEIEASLFSKGKGGRRSMNLVRFVVGSRTKNRKRGQIKLRIRRDAGLKTIKGAFLAPTRGSGMFLARRIGKERLPIEGLQVIDVPQMFNTRRLNSRVVRKIQAVLGERFEREAQYYLARYQGRAARPRRV
jgi:hypothetical protein